MSVAAATNTTTTTSATGSSSGNAGVSANNMGNTQMFLKLLIAQMKNQDPTKPQDPTQMVTQLAQFNTLQQQISSNQYLKQMASAQSSNSSNAASYLGHTAVVNTSKFSFDGTNAQKFLVNLSSAAANATVNVVDSNGNTVATLNNGALPAGTTPLSWSGTMSNGLTAPIGQYSIQVNATDSSQQSVSSTTQTMGTVSAVDLSSTGTQLVVNGSPVSMSNISQIRM